MSLSEYERECLERKIRDINAWLADIDCELDQKGLASAQIAKMSPQEQAIKDTEAAQLLRRERGILLAERARSERKLRGSSPKEQRQALEIDDRNRRYLDMREAESREVIERNIQRFTAVGEHRQAIVWKQQLVGLRERIARDELGIGR